MLFNKDEFKKFTLTFIFNKKRINPNKHKLNNKNILYSDIFFFVIYS